MNDPRSLSLPPNPALSLPPGPSGRGVPTPAPSLGFWILTASLLFMAGFFGWAARTPLLEDAFKVLCLREHDDFTVYGESDVRILSRALVQYPGMSRALLGRRGTARFLEPTTDTDGWLTRPLGHLALRNPPKAALVLSVQARGLAEDFPLEVSIVDGKRRSAVTFDEPMTKTLPIDREDASQPSIAAVNVRAARATPAKETPTWGVRFDSESLPASETSP
jgi:hypothetical protein